MSEHQSKHSRVRLRAHPVGDLSERLPLRRALPLVAVETLGLAVLATAYWLLDARTMTTGPLLVPLAVTFVLIVAAPKGRAARPLRVLLAYVFAAGVGLAIASLPGPQLPALIASVFATLLLMHLSGVFHAPAVAVTVVAVITDYTFHDALISFAQLMPLTVLTLALAWLSNRALGDSTYPERWW